MYVGPFSSTALMFLSSHSDTPKLQIFYTAEQQQHSYLSSPPWMDIPFRLLSKRPLERLMDVLAQAPSLQLRAGALPNILSEELRFQEVRELIDCCWQLDAQLEKIYSALEQSVRGPSSHTDVSSSHDEANSVVVSDTITFTTIADAKAILLLWSLQTLLWSGMTALYDFPGFQPSIEGETSGTPFRTSTTTTTLRPLRHRSNWITSVRQICASLTFCLCPEHGTLGPLAVAAPLGILKGVLVDHPKYARELHHVRMVLERIGSDGLRILKYA